MEESIDDAAASSGSRRRLRRKTLDAPLLARAVAKARPMPGVVL